VSSVLTERRDPLAGPGNAASAQTELPGVSVVVPAHNYAHYLPMTIGSVLAQTYRGLEIIVVDDGSTDNTREVVARYEDPRVRYVWQANAGLSAARNKGIEVAQMPFVGFLDADDVWLPDFVNEAMRQFATLGDRYAVVAAITGRMDQHGRELTPPRFTFHRSGECTTRDFVMRNLPLSSSLIARRSVFAECGLFDTTLRSSEDRDMWIRITMRHRFWLIERPLALVRRHGGNMSKNAPQMKRNSLAVMLKAWRSGSVSRLAVVFWLRAFSLHHAQTSWTHFEGGYRWRAFAFLGISVLLWPVFLKPSRVYEPPLFRVRTFVRFSQGVLRSLFAGTPKPAASNG
jgi:glycosyltransferase involved in cell wall biosynthesis